MPQRSPLDIFPDGRGLYGEACGILSVDLDALASNWRTARKLGGGAECGAVVKGNAYGTGIEPAVSALLDAGARTFFTATLGEARRVRAVTPEATIYALNGLLPGTARVYAACGLRPVLGSMEEVAEWRAGGGGTAALHVDTGMNRLGLRLNEAAALAGDPGFPVALVMTHMACADEPGHPLNQAQMQRFEQVRAAFPGAAASLANSASIAWLGCADRYDLSRPGIALYGGEPIAGHDNPFRPVVRLDCPALLVRDVASGETVGYGAGWTARRDSRIAVVGAGYADGFHRCAGAKGDARPYHVALGEARAPLAGRVNMDLLTIDVTDLPSGSVVRGTPITVLGGPIPLSETASHFGTNVYEVLTSLGDRYQRRYTGTL
ncbi:MAG: alanine racemase [Rhodobiaceae bacterium]|nr:alanine racemase [Rhodobiaceae bacterium]MCC0041709.1 alanine racemase [Rhodobiaceae bacterium]